MDEDKGARSLNWGGGVVGMVGLVDSRGANGGGGNGSGSSSWMTSCTIKCERSRSLWERGGIGGCENLPTFNLDSDTESV